MNFFLFIVVAALMLASVEFVKRRSGLPVYVTRKLAHVFGALIAFLAPFFLSRWEIIALAALFAVFLFASKRVRLLTSVHLDDRATYGEVFLPLGVLLSAFLFLPDETAAFQFGVLVMGFSDAAAGLIGERYGKRTFKVFGAKKSAEGALSFFAVSLLIALQYAPEHPIEAGFTALVLTGVELCLSWGLDNMVLPSLAAYVFITLT